MVLCHQIAPLHALHVPVRRSIRNAPLVSLQHVDRRAVDSVHY